MHFPSAPTTDCPDVWPRTRCAAAPAPAGNSPRLSAASRGPTARERFGRGTTGIASLGGLPAGRNATGSILALTSDKRLCYRTDSQRGLVPGILESTGKVRAVRVRKCGSVLGALGPWLEGLILGEMGESAPWGT